ncbi:TIM barrel protein, partial [Acidobacteria bacterium AH-259-A15]|nr:TIM barrel protein [Acidobacteria bacterium AH-259-A15]
MLKSQYTLTCFSLTLAALLWGVLGGASSAAPGKSGRDILYVTNSGGNDVTLVDVATLKPIGSIETGSTPHGLEASPDGSRLYVSGETDDDIVVIDTATSTVLWRAYIGDRPNHIALSAHGRYVYVPIRSADYADVVDTHTKRRIKSIPVGRSPHNAYLAPNKKWIYVTSMGEHKITIIDVATQSVIGAVPVGGVPRPAGFTKDNKFMYVALTGLHGFVVADIAQGKVIDKVELPPADVEVVSTMGYTPTHGLGFRPDYKQFWITNVFGNAVEALSIPDHKLVGTVPVGLAPNWMTFGLGGKFLYVSNSGSHDVSVIDTEAIKEVTRVRVGLAPKRLLVVNVPKGMGGPDEAGWRNAAKRPSSSDYYLKGGGILSCETYSFRDKFRSGELTLESAPAFYRKLGIRGIAINASYLQSQDGEYLEGIKRALREEQRVLTAVTLGGNLVSDDEAANRKQIEKNKRLLRAAHYLGAPVVRINVGRTGRGDVADQTVGVERAIAAFREMLPLAKELGIRMTIENHGGPSKTANGILRIIKGTDPAWVGACPDFGNWEDKAAMYAEIEKLAPFAYHTHVKSYEFDRYGNETTIDYRRALDPLESTGYGAALSIEFEGKGDPVQGVIKTR